MKKLTFSLIFLVLPLQAVGDIVVVGENAELNIPLSAVGGRLICDTGSNITWLDRIVSFNTWNIVSETIGSLEVGYDDITYSGWRLPTCAEMHRVWMEEFGQDFSFQETFKAISAAGATYWSGDLSADGTQACYFNFGSGSVADWGIGQWNSGIPVRPGCIEPPGVDIPAIVLLFDGSGSMSWSFEGDHEAPEEDQRLFFVKQAVNPFMDKLLDFVSDPAIPQEIQFGIARFPYDPYHMIHGCSAEALYGMTKITSQSHSGAVGTEISALVATGDTPMIAGLERATDMLSGINRKAIVLLSDGYHNCPSTVVPGDPAYDTLIDMLAGEGIRVYTIGFAPPGDVDDHFLGELADDTGGYFHSVTDDPGFPESWVPETAIAPEGWDPQTGLAKAYYEILVDYLGLQPLVDPHGVIKGGEKLTRQVSVSEHEKKLIFFLSWSTPEKARLGLTVKGSDKKSVELSPQPGVKTYNGDTYKIITVDHSFLQSPGKVGLTPWEIEIDATGMSPKEQEYYQYSVAADSGLKMSVKFDKSHYDTGDLVTLEVRFAPKKHLPFGDISTMQVEVTRPIEGLGNWLATNKVSQQQLSKIPAKVKQEKRAPIQRKVRFLKENNKVKLPGRTAPIRLELFDDGTHGDKRDGDCIYTTQFSDTVKEGVYAFRIRVRGSTKDGSPFQRETMLQKYVAVNVSPDHVVVSAQSADVSDKSKRYVLTITPKDALGNHLGPNHSGRMAIGVSKGAIVEHLKDNLDGTYSQVIELPRALDIADVDVTITIKEKELPFKLGDKVAN